MHFALELGNNRLALVDFDDYKALADLPWRARTLRNSYRTKGLSVPDQPVRVELTSPSGELWTFGPEDALDRVSGTALDFCLVVTQRRHLADATWSLPAG